VITELQSIQDQLNAISGDVGAVISEISTIYDQLVAANLRLDDLYGEMQQANATLDDISDTVDAQYQYLRNGANVDPIVISPRSPSFDSTPPAIADPSPGPPYKYDRQTAAVPAPIDSPEPLPAAPDPVIPPHDDPLPAQSPRTPEPPVAAQPPVTPEQAKTPDPALSPQMPLTPDTPLTPNAPIAPTAPLTPDPPLTPPLTSR
jgi:hypothetical protein